MESPIRLYTPNGTGGSRKRTTRPAKQSEVTGSADRAPLEPATKAVPKAKPARVPKKGPASRRGPATTPADAHPANEPSLLPVQEKAEVSVLVDDLPEWTEE